MYLDKHFFHVTHCTIIMPVLTEAKTHKKAAQPFSTKPDLSGSWNFFFHVAKKRSTARTMIENISVIELSIGIVTNTAQLPPKTEAKAKVLFRSTW